MAPVVMSTSLKNSPYLLTYIWTAKSLSFSFEAFQMKTLKQFFQNLNKNSPNYVF